MANAKIKGLTVEIGGDTSNLDEALKGVEGKSKSLSDELGRINRLLKLDPTNTELLAQKQEVLAEAISSTEEKLSMLKEAEKSAQAQFEAGNVSAEQYRALKQEIAATELKLKRYKEAAAETGKAVADLADGTNTAVKATKEEKEAAEQAAKAEKAAGEAADEMRDGMVNLAKKGLTAVVAAASAAVTAVVALAEESREYRNNMAKLNTAFEMTNHSGKEATQTYKALQSVLGETDQAVEAANMLAQLCSNEDQLNRMTEALTGVYAMFGDSLPLEGLAEAANETAKTGAVTGSLADALNWASIPAEKWGSLMAGNVEAQAAFNAAMAEGENVEDAFTAALGACTDEQERSALIVDALSGAYTAEAQAFKKANKEVIRANEITEEWNEITAEAGETVEPLVNDVKELGVAMAKKAVKPLKEICEYVGSDLLPKLTKVSSWTVQHGPQITSAIAGVTAALAVHKAAVLSDKLASEGATVATLAHVAAKKALNAAMAGGGWGLALTAIAGVTAAILALNAATQAAKEPLEVLTDEEKKLVEASAETAQAFREQQEATQAAISGVNQQYDHISALANELQTLADASGRVQEKDQARAQFILGELNDALGTEYKMVDGVIQQYGNLTENITEVIAAKKAEAVLEAFNDDYIAAIKNQGDAYNALLLSQKDYAEHLEVTKQKEAELAEAEAAYAAAREEYARTGSTEAQREMIQASATVGAKRMALSEENEILAEKQAAYEEAAAAYGEYTDTIANYEEAQTAAIEGNYEKVQGLLVDKGAAYSDYADDVDEETAKVLETLKKEAIDAGAEAKRVRENWENGVEGYTEEMVKEAEDSYQELLSAYADAYADAYGVGGDLGDGLENGLENKRLSLYAKARNIVTGIIGSMRTAADSHSPARKTIAFGEDVGAGAEIGLENSTPDVAEAARKQATAMIDAYQDQEVEAQRALEKVAARNVTIAQTAHVAATSTSTPMLEKILAAIERGQVITLDGKSLVGATANDYDSALGQRRALKARGAL